MDNIEGHIIVDKRHSQSGMSLVVKTVARWIVGFIIVFGIYVVLYGHETPGGGFAGGVAIAGAFILLTLALGLQVAFRTLGNRPAALLASTGVLFFLGLAMAGLFVANAFFKNFIVPVDHSQPGLFGAVFILLCEIGVAVVVAMSIFRIFSALSQTRVSKNQ